MLWQRLTDRRTVLVGLLSAACMLVAGCSAEQLAGLNFVSPQEEQQLGLQTWHRLRQERPPSRNPALQAALQRVGSRIVAANGGKPQNWEFVVFQGPEVNAFALPGGKVGVYEGMFNVAQNDAQLAAVVGHEIGHVNAHHTAERVSAAEAEQIGLQLAGIALQLGNIGYANQIAALLGAGLEYGVLLPYSRQQEYEADRLGMEYMARAGYPPQEALTFWMNMQHAGGARPPEFLSTHPSGENRIAAIREFLPAAEQIYRRS